MPNPRPRYQPLWKKISGLYPHCELDLDYGEYEKRLAKLYKEFERLLREECAAPDNSEAAEYRTHLWDPLAKVLYKLGISRAQMSRYSKQLSGLAAHEVLDKIRAENVTRKIRKDIRLFVAKMAVHQIATGNVTAFPPNHAKRKPGEEGRFNWPPSPSLRYLYYGMLKATRREGDFDLNTWAIEHGFPNWSRFRKACLIVHRKTPRQLEMDALLEYEREISEISGIEVVTLDSIDPRFYPLINDRLLEGQPETPLTKHSWPKPRPKFDEDVFETPPPEPAERPREELALVE